MYTSSIGTREYNHFFQIYFHTSRVHMRRSRNIIDRDNLYSSDKLIYKIAKSRICKHKTSKRLLQTYATLFQTFLCCFLYTLTSVSWHRDKERRIRRLLHVVEYSLQDHQIREDMMTSNSYRNIVLLAWGTKCLSRRVAK